MKDENNQNVVSFGKSSIVSVAGIIGGTVLAICIPWIVLTHGDVLGQKVNTILVIGSILIGGLVMLTSAFFGLVMPNKVEGHEEMKPLKNKFQKMK